MYKGVLIHMGVWVPINIAMNIGMGVPNIISFWGRGGGGGGGALKLGVVMTLDIMPGYLESSGAKPISLLLAINAGYESMLVLAIFFVIVFPAFFSTLLVVAMCRLSTACHP